MRRLEIAGSSLADLRAIAKECRGSGTVLALATRFREAAAAVAKAAAAGLPAAVACAPAAAAPPTGPLHGPHSAAACKARAQPAASSAAAVAMRQPACGPRSGAVRKQMRSLEHRKADTKNAAHDGMAVAEPPGAKRRMPMRGRRCAAWRTTGKENTTVPLQQH